MKKNICLLLLLTIQSLAFSQHFTLTPDGICSSTQSDKDYVVLEFPGKTQAELYEAAENFVVANYISAKDVISKSAPNIISAYAKFPFSFNDIFRRDVAMEYKYTLSFKDGKIKVEFSVLNFYFLGSGVKPKVGMSIVRSGIGYGIFKKNGKVVIDTAKEDIENCANRSVESLIEAINGTNDEW